MEKFIAAAAAVLTVVLLAGPAFAGQPPGGDPGKPPGQMSPERQKEMENRKAEEEQRFNDQKAEKVKSLSNRISEMQEKMAAEQKEAQNRIAEMERTRDCIQAAADPQAFGSCWPKGGPARKP